LTGPLCLGTQQSRALLRTLNDPQAVIPALMGWHLYQFHVGRQALAGPGMRAKDSVSCTRLVPATTRLFQRNLRERCVLMRAKSIFLAHDAKRSPFWWITGTIRQGRFLQ
jgi:hypothetical protein